MANKRDSELHKGHSAGEGPAAGYHAGHLHRTRRDRAELYR